LHCVKQLRSDSSLTWDEGIRYPDLLLSSDHNGADILQNWEFKFPDTPIDDEEFFNNARHKSELLRTGSFVISNLQHTRLYRRNSAGAYELKDSCDFPIKLDRDAVQVNVDDLIKHLSKFLAQVDLLFRTGELAAASEPKQYIPTLISSFIDECRPGYASHLAKALHNNDQLKERMDSWWAVAQLEYPNRSAVDAYASQVAFQLATTVFFMHCVAAPAKLGKRIAAFHKKPSIAALLAICVRANQAVDFQNIFGAATAFRDLSESLLHRAANLSRFLTTIKISEVPRSQLRDPVASILTRDTRRIIGHFSTPDPIAQLLVALADLGTNDTLLDPCCGSGTIFEAARTALADLGLDASKINARVWASDKFALPVYMTTLRAADPANYAAPLRIVQRDCLDLRPLAAFRLQKPNGQELTVRLPRFNRIVTNLPFVRFERKNLSSLAGYTSSQAMAHIAEAHASLGNRIDAYAVLSLYLPKLLSSDGRAVILTSNSWLGVQWSSQFLQQLQSLFTIDTLIMESGPRWFEDAQVRCTILVLRPKAAEKADAPIIFARPKIAFDRSPRQFVNSLAADVKSPTPEFFHVNRHTLADLQDLETNGLSWRTGFYDTSWLPKVIDKTVLANSCFPTIERGLRGGDNAFFYPKDRGSIEDCYLRPLIKRNHERRYRVKPDGFAFVCKFGLTHLKNQGHIGALQWIKQHEPDRPSQSVAGKPWYFLGKLSDAQLVTTLNPDDVLLFASPTRRSIIDQRMIAFGGSTLDRILGQALMNSLITLLWLEQLGFSRGLGALDLNMRKVRDQLRMPDPEQLSERDKKRIVDHFRPLRLRVVRPIPEELLKDDRVAFDTCLFSALGIADQYPKMRDTLISMVADRTMAAGD